MSRQDQTSALFFIPTLGGGGAEKVMITVANEAMRRGLNVSIVVGSSDGPYRELIAEGVTVIDLKAPRLRNAFSPLIRVIRSENPDVIYSTIIIANLMVALAHKVTKSRAKLILREAISARFLKAEGKLSYLILRTLARRAYRWADVVVSVSKATQDDLIDFLGGEKNTSFKVIYNPIYPEIYTLSELEPDKNTILSIEKAYVVAAGRLSKQKDYPTLLKAMSIVQRTQDIGLLILGEGEERDHLERLSQDLGLKDVLMPGFVKNPYPAVKQAALFVLSSKFEGLPNALLDAVALGVPAVSTDCPTGPVEILEGGKYGRLVEVGNENQLASAILEQLNSLHKSEYSRPDLSRFDLDFVVSEYLGAAGIY